MGSAGNTLAPEKLAEIIGQKNGRCWLILRGAFARLSSEWRLNVTCDTLQSPPGVSPMWHVIRFDAFMLFYFVLEGMHLFVKNFSTVGNAVDHYCWVWFISCNYINCLQFCTKSTPYPNLNSIIFIADKGFRGQDFRFRLYIIKVHNTTHLIIFSNPTVGEEQMQELLIFIFE